MRLQLDTEILYVDGLGDYYLKEMKDLLVHINENF